MDALTAFIPLVGVVLVVTVLAVLTGVVSRSSAPALQYWTLHPWRVFWLSYVLIFAGLLLWTVLWPIALTVLLPGVLLLLTSATQGLRVTWMRSRRRAVAILLISFVVLLLPGLTQGRPIALISSPLSILLWMFSAWLAKTVGSQRDADASARKTARPELTTCNACGTKNASHRSVCLMCGVSLSPTELPVVPRREISTGWFKLLFKSFPERCREAMRQSYQKHYDLARSGLAPPTSDPHHAGLFGALGTRYKVRGVLRYTGFPDVVLWPELAPFFLMSQQDAVEALAEYVLWQERPSAARTEWLARKINDALHTNPSSENSPRHLASAAFINQVKWSDLLDPENRTTLSREAEQLSGERDSDNSA